eukprot:07641.XXX_66709_66828_1 [CDS] Oithona nana genome sequencing.
MLLTGVSHDIPAPLLALQARVEPTAGEEAMRRKILCPKN